jgi:hypothetical protein
MPTSCNAKLASSEKGLHLQAFFIADYNNGDAVVVGRRKPGISQCKF